MVVQQQVIEMQSGKRLQEEGTGCTGDGGKLVYDEAGASTGWRSASA